MIQPASFRSFPPGRTTRNPHPIPQTRDMVPGHTDSCRELGEGGVQWTAFSSVSSLRAFPPRHGILYITFYIMLYFYIVYYIFLLAWLAGLLEWINELMNQWIDAWMNDRFAVNPCTSMQLKAENEGGLINSSFSTQKSWGWRRSTKWMNPHKETRKAKNSTANQQKCIWSAWTSQLF